METFDDEFGGLSEYRILSFEEVNKGLLKDKNPFEGIASRPSFEKKSFEKRLGKSGVNDICAETKGDFYSENMDFNKIQNDLRDRTNENFFFYYQNYALTNPMVPIGVNFGAVSVPTRYIPKIYFEYDQGDEIKSALLSVELNKRACYISLKDYGSRFYLNPEKEEMKFELKFVYTDYLDKRNFNDATGDYELAQEYNAIIISTSDANGFVALSEKLRLENASQNEILQLFAEKVKETHDTSSLKFLYENMPDFVTKGLLAKLEDKFNNEIVITKDKKTGKTKALSAAQILLWKHLEKLVDNDDQGYFSWTRDSSGAVLNLLKVFGNSPFIFESFKNNQAMVKRIFDNMDKTSVVNGREWSNKTLFANFITALCIDNAFEGLRMLDKEFTIGNGYAISSGSLFQEEKDNELFLQQMQKVTRIETDIIPDDLPFKVERVQVERNSLEAKEQGDLYHPMDIVRLNYADIKEAPFPFVSAMTIKAFAEERDQQLRADAIRIGFDVLAIVLAVAFFPAAGAVGVAAEAVGIGLALADIGITASREAILLEPGGEEFLDYWDKVYLVGGIALASTAMIEQVFAKSLFCYLEAVKSGSKLAEAYQKSLGKILLEKEVLTFAGNTLKPNSGIKLEILAYNSSKIPRATEFALGKEESLLPLYKAGAVVVEIGEKEYALVYKGEKILQDFYNEKWRRSFYQELKKSFKIPEKLEAKLENLYKLIPKLSEDKKFWTCFNDAGTELRWSNVYEKDIEKSINAALASSNGGKLWEGEVARELSRYDKITDFGNIFDIIKNGKRFNNAGDIDVGSSKYIIECKESVSKNIKAKDFIDQFDKYLNPKNEKYINPKNRKSVLAIKSFKDNAIDVSHPVFKELQKRGVIIITNLNQIKNLK